jgi:hypothetical protein
MGPKRPDVRREPRVVDDVFEQQLRLLGQRARLARLLGPDSPVRAVVGVDEVVVVLPDPQAELDVPPGRTQRSNSAA